MRMGRIQRVFAVASATLRLMMVPAATGFSLSSRNRSGAVPRGLIRNNVPTRHSMTLLASNDSKDDGYNSRVGGLKEGLAILSLSLIVSVWLFSIPTEFRRARFCSEQESAIYEQCYTVDQWTSGIADYYKNGGRVQFDFSVDPATLERNGFTRE